MSDKAASPEWTVRPERGALPLMTLGVQIALWLGRRTARLFLYPICLYYLASSAKASHASRKYLGRVLGRQPGIADVFRHYLTFASCVLDRVFFLNEQIDQFEIRVHGGEVVREILDRGDGCVLFGAHFGSFEVARAVGRRHGNVPISLVMYEENARKIRAALGAINPQLETEVIGLGRMDSLIAVADRLKRGHFVGLLVDRNVNGEDCVRLPFLGMPAPFPRGPFRMAILLRKPVVMMVGIYRGGRAYEVFFEALFEPTESRAGKNIEAVDSAMRRYVARLEAYCRAAPFNWFNFYDFWA